MQDLNLMKHLVELLNKYVANRQVALEADNNLFSKLGLQKLAPDN